MNRTGLFAIAVIAGLVTTPGTLAQGWKPSRNVELVAASAAGGGSDNLARLVQKILQEQKIIDVSMTVINKPASGGVVAWSGLNQNPMDGHHLSISTANLLTNHITGRSTLHYSDVTSVAQLFSEAVGIAVRTESPLRNGRELAALLKADAGAVSAAIGTSLGNSGHIALALVTLAAGGDAKKLKAVVFQSVSQGVTALIGGHVDVISTAASNLAAHHIAGRIRIIGLTAPQRYAGALAAVPTWREQGISVDVDNLRGVIGPKAMSAAQIAYWEAALARVVATPEWKVHLEKNQWTENFAGAQASRKILSQQHDAMRAGLAALGMEK
ncbi:MAG TPA: tripartite tricarboxylate transporter substrate binding protein [Burkholderiales bacterium]|nr:tripartite tricarboxylate transporter substrate binding protein [Burkholderiales bacterium]